MPATFGCSVPTRGPMSNPDSLRSLAQRAEDLGFDSIWVSDHIILPRQVDSFYPYAADGVPTFKPDESYYEPLAALNFLAGCTQRIRLGTHVLILPYRNPVLTAKILSTLDVLSGGRVILGAGVGWMEEEFLALGLDTFHERGAVTDEYLQLYKELWTKDEPEFHGRYYDFPPVYSYPKPVQKPHPPILLGGNAKNVLQRVSRVADGWLPTRTTPKVVDESRKILDTLAIERGRDPASLSISVFGQAPDTTRGQVDDFLNAGAERVSVWANHCDTEQAMGDQLEQMAETLVR